MKKILLLIITIFSLFSFNSKVLALGNASENISSNILIGAEAKDIFKICDVNEGKRTLGAFKLGGIFIALAKIIAPIILIIMGMIDVSKAVTAGKDDAIKKSFSSFLKRSVAAILIFFTPSIVLALFTFVDGFDNTESAYKGCIDCLLKPGECQGTFGFSSVNSSKINNVAKK